MAGEGRKLLGSRPETEQPKDSILVQYKVALIYIIERYKENPRSELPPTATGRHLGKMLSRWILNALWLMCHHSWDRIVFVIFRLSYFIPTDTYCEWILSDPRVFTIWRGNSIDKLVRRKDIQLVIHFYFIWQWQWQMFIFRHVCPHNKKCIHYVHCY